MRFLTVVCVASLLGFCVTPADACDVYTCKVTFGAYSPSEDDWVAFTTSPTTVDEETCFGGGGLVHRYTGVGVYENCPDLTGRPIAEDLTVVTSSAGLSGEYQIGADIEGACFKICETCE